MIVTAGGRQVGKSTKLFKRLRKALKSGKRCLLVGFNHQNARVLFRNYLHLFEKEDTLVYQEHSLEIIGGKGFIKFMSYDQTQGRGFNRSDYNFVVIDEIQALVRNLNPNYVTVTSDEFLGGVGDYLLSKVPYETVRQRYADREPIKTIDETDECFYIQHTDNSISRLDK